MFDQCESCRFFRSMYDGNGVCMKYSKYMSEEDYCDNYVENELWEDEDKY